MDTKVIELYFKDRLAKDPNFADVDVSPQSGFHDLVVKGHLVLSNSIFDQLAYVNAGSSLDNAATMSKAQLDSYAANWFTFRRTESKITVLVDVYIADGYNDPLTVLSTDTFTAKDGSVCSTAQDLVFLPATLPYVNILGVNYRHASFNTISNGTTEIGKSQITGFTITHPGIVSVTNESASSTPVPAETNEVFVNRLKKSFGTNSFINLYSATKMLHENFSISDCYMIGYGDPEMQRDIAVLNTAWSFHAGNTIDVYIKSTLRPTSFSVRGFRLPNQNAYRFYMKRYKGFDVFGNDRSNPNPGMLYGWQKIELPDNAYMIGATSLPEMPMMFIDFGHIKATSLIDPSQTLTVNDLAVLNGDYHVEVKPIRDNLRFSIYEQLQIDVYFTKSLEEMVDLYFSYYTLDSLEEIQAFVSDPNNMANADIVVKSFIPVEVSNLTIFTDKKYAFDNTSMRKILADYINTWNSAEPISLSTLLQKIPSPAMIAEVGRDFQNPNHIIADQSSAISPSLIAGYAGPSFAEMRQQNVDGSVWHYYSTRTIGMIENPVLSATRRTVRYFIDPEDIHFKTF